MIKPREQTSPYILWLDQPEAQTAQHVGAKAAHLARLVQARLPVPHGFCITIQSYRDARSDHAVLPDSMKTQIVDAYRCLLDRAGTDTKVAVRSSASAEDRADASFAGQYLSLLNVSGEAELLNAILRCWQSATAVQVQTYQAAHQLNHVAIEMAVIVQAMVAAECAGVLFTTDPVSQDANAMPVEMIPGLGDAVAAGTTMPIHFALDRKTRKVSHHNTIQAKTIAWELLRDLALKVEAAFGSPQDIEWAYHDGRFWILQSRPISTQVQHTLRRIWTRANVGEILPSAVTPLTWSIFKPILQWAGWFRSLSPLTIHWRWQAPGGEWVDAPRLFHGRAYVELGGVYASFAGLPGVTSELLQKVLGFEFDLCRPHELPAKRPRYHVMDPYRAFRFWSEMLGITHTLARQARRVQNDQAPIILNDPDRVLEQVDALMKDAAKVFGLHLQCTAFAFSAFGLLHRIVEKHADTEAVRKFEAELIADFQGISTVQQTLGIWELAQRARQQPEVERTLLETESPQQIIDALRRLPEAAEFLQHWVEFMTRFGDRSTDEFELSIAHWNEDPSFVLQTLRDILAHPHVDPRERLNRQHVAGEHSLQEMRALIRSKGSTIDSFMFSRLIASYQQLVPLRENVKYAVIRRFNQIRKLFVELGKSLQRRGAIDDAQDIFYLAHAEIRDLLEQNAQSSIDVQARVAQRRQAQDKHAAMSAPELWVSVDSKDAPMHLPRWQSRDTLYGIGCSPGQITGTACVMHSPQDEVKIMPGQILVAPSIDPGLTPLFLLASGLVTEIGGVLSHGATVAREYGLPAVVGVPSATQSIQNGQQITVDGFTGAVHLGPLEGK